MSKMLYQRLGLSTLSSTTPGGDDPWPDVVSTCTSQPIHLWQFLRELLLKPHNYSRCIRWLNKEKGELTGGLHNYSCWLREVGERGWHDKIRIAYSTMFLNKRTSHCPVVEGKTLFRVSKHGLIYSIHRNIQNRRLCVRGQVMGHQEEPPCHEL